MTIHVCLFSHVVSAGLKSVNVHISVQNVYKCHSSSVCHGDMERRQIHWWYFHPVRKAFPLGSARMTTPQQAMLMPKIICAIVPGPGGYPSFMGFRAVQYTYPPAPISPDPESTRQLQQLLNRGACSGEAGAPVAVTCAGLAVEVASGVATNLTGSRGCEAKEPILRK